MAYGDITGVERLLSRKLKGQGGGFSNDTNPTNTEVEAMLVDIYNEINAELSGAGVSPVPAVNTTAVAALALYNCLGAAALAAGKAGLGDMELSEELRTQYEDRLTLISQGKGVAAMLLSSANINTPISNYTEGDYEEDSEGDQKRAFTKGQVW